MGDQYSGECERGAGERVETKGGVAGAGPGSDVTITNSAESCYLLITMALIVK